MQGHRISLPGPGVSEFTVGEVEMMVDFTNGQISQARYGPFLACILKLSLSKMI